MITHNNNSSQTIDTELVNDLRFLVVEVTHLLDMVEQAITSLDAKKIPSIMRRDDYVDNLKDRIETLCYHRITKLTSDTSFLMGHYRALIRISSNLEKIADFLVQAARQIKYIQSQEHFACFDLEEFYNTIREHLELIPMAFTLVSEKIAKRICASEKTLDDLYLKKFLYIQEHIASKNESDDMITLLFMVRYFERAGDALENIGEAILNISMGEALNIRHYKNLELAVKKIFPKNTKISYEFHPILYSRSGCKVGKLIFHERVGDDERIRLLFYKEGMTNKIVEEIDGIKLWNKIAPGTVPKVKWKAIRKNHSTLMMEYFVGENLLSLILKNTPRQQISSIIKLLLVKLDDIWSSNIQKKKVSTEFIKQIISREKDILKVHDDFFDEFTNKETGKVTSFKKILSKAKTIEKKVATPFQVLCHGDFNLDNIIYLEEEKAIRFIDVHRSGYSDYAQEIAVFIVSALRVKVKDPKVKKKIAFACKSIFEFGKEFAGKQGDDYFQVRLAFGLFRSFVTSTRFLFDDEWYGKMRHNAIVMMDTLSEAKGNLKKYSFDLDKILK